MERASERSVTLLTGRASNTISRGERLVLCMGLKCASRLMTGLFYIMSFTINKMAERAGAANPCAFGTSGMSPAEQARMPEAGRDT